MFCSEFIRIEFCLAALFVDYKTINKRELLCLIELSLKDSIADACESLTCHFLWQCSF
jgi:hypothetical protein